MFESYLGKFWGAGCSGSLAIGGTRGLSFDLGGGRYQKSGTQYFPKSSTGVWEHFQKVWNTHLPIGLWASPNNKMPRISRNTLKWPRIILITILKILTNQLKLLINRKTIINRRSMPTKSPVFSPIGPSFCYFVAKFLNCVALKLRNL